MRTKRTTDKKTYQRAYYRAHKEKMKEYQRNYQRKHRSPSLSKGHWGRSASFKMPRETKVISINASQIMHSPVEKSLKLLNGVIRGEIMFSI